MAGEVLPYVQGASLKGSAAVLVRLSSSPATSAAGGRFTIGELSMQPSYSVLADALSKFHTAPEWIQALWLIAGSATMLGIAHVTGQVLREGIRFLARRGEPCGTLVYGVYEDPQGRLMVHREGAPPSPVMHGLVPGSRVFTPGATGKRG
jgi:hypothetical protein